MPGRAGVLAKWLVMSLEQDGGGLNQPWGIGAARLHMFKLV